MVRHRETSTALEVENLTANFTELSEDYQIQEKIGEGTFSSVYKALDLKYDMYQNPWDRDELSKGEEYETGERGQTQRYVAIKRIYVTSSQTRILNELRLLKLLSGCKSIVPIITAIRSKDQILAIMPYYHHHDFNVVCTHITLDGMASYMRQLLEALDFIHKRKIMHRDVKPGNFLYNYKTQKGMLVDFGLAEEEKYDKKRACICTTGGINARIEHLQKEAGYKKDDSGSTRRAPRAGTRGFRAPEVLFKCQSQTTKIDIWSAGVTFLSLMSQRLPFFPSKDDGDSLLELASIFGRIRVQQCGLIHGSVFETNIPTIQPHGYGLDKIIYFFWRELAKEQGKEVDEHSNAVKLSTRERQAVDLLKRLLALDFRQRASASQALRHDFLTQKPESSQATLSPEDGL